MVSPAVAASTAASRGTPIPRAARDRSEVLVKTVLLSFSLLSIVTTFSIVAVLGFEAWRFFTGFPDTPGIGIIPFLTGTEWNPLLGGEQKFGVLPLVCGTLLVTFIAGAIALPIGLITAIFLSEYAPSRLRIVLKSLLEILAGVPTVVYGFFAVAIITPALQRFSDAFGTFNALSAGIAVGIMILPVVCSLSEDALRAVPQSLRDGSSALGGTKFDTSVKVVLPAALSGIMASFLLALTRAIGETMIVALAAGSLAQMTLNPTNPVQTMTGWIVDIFFGDAQANSVEYASSYAVAATLFLMTLVLTLVGTAILKRFREEYE
jgi:phosphate transport system permease protein